MPETPRRSTFDTDLKPVRVKDLKPVYLDEDEQVDCAEGQSPNRKHTLQQQMSFNQEGEVIASFRPRFEYVDAYKKREELRGLRGRPRKSTPYDLFFFHHFRKMYRSEMRAAKEIQDPGNWERFRRAVEEAFPDNPEWRLSEEQPNRSRYRTFMKSHILNNPEELALLEDSGMDAAIEAALHIGLFDPNKGSFSKPDKTRTVYGDLSFFRGRYNRGRSEAVDKETGEIIHRFDPDAHDHTGNNKNEKGSPGLTVDLLGARNNSHPNERIPIILTVKDPDITEGEYLVQQIERLLTKYPEVRKGMIGVAYDMAIKPVHIDKLYRLGVIPFIKVSLNNSGDVPIFKLFDQNFRLRNGTTMKRDVHLVDGTPCVTFMDGEGDHYYQPLRRVNTSRNKNDTPSNEELPSYRWYGNWEVPENPLLYPLGGATIRIRLDSPQEEIEGDTGKRSNALRAIPCSDPYFKKVFGVREDAESLFANLKTPLLHRRLPCVGRNRLRVDLLGSQGIAIIRALVAWHERTGGDVSAFFGQRCPLPRDGPHACP